MNTLHRICLWMVLAMTGQVLVPGQAALCAGRNAEGRGQRSHAGRRNMWSFDKDKAGSVPQGWKVAETRGQGTPAKWQVVRDGTAPSVEG